MVNKKGGKKHKRGKKNSDLQKKLRYKEEGQEYAQIKAAKGNCRFDLSVFDGKERMGILCGTMRKRRFVNARDVVLVSIRDFEDAKCDIIDVYDDNQVRQLKSEKEIPDSIKLEEENDYNPNEYNPFDIADSSDEEEDNANTKEKESSSEEEEEVKINLDDI
jgi:translation initiation factor 1A